jgi:branched-subunit amino acid transport protein
MSTSGSLHSLGFFVAFLALIAGCFVLSRHFGQALPSWRNTCLIAGVATPLLIVLGTALSGAAGVFYLAAGTISFTWLSVVAWRLVAELPPRSASRR